MKTILSAILTLSMTLSAQAHQDHPTHSETNNLESVAKNYVHQISHLEEEIAARAEALQTSQDPNAAQLMEELMAESAARRESLRQAAESQSQFVTTHLIAEAQQKARTQLQAAAAQTQLLLEQLVPSQGSVEAQARRVAQCQQTASDKFQMASQK